MSNILRTTDAQAYAVQSERERQINLEQRVVKAILQATIGCTKAMTNDASKMTCDYINQYGRVCFATRKFNTGRNFGEVIMALWCLDDGYNIRMPELPFLQTLAESYPERPVIFVTKYKSPADFVAFYYEPENDFNHFDMPLPSPVIHFRNPILKRPVLLGTLGNILKVVAPFYNGILPRSLIE